MKYQKILPLLLVGTLALTACGTTNDNTNNNTEGNAENAITQNVIEQTDEDMFTNRDLNTDYDETGAVSIQLNGSSVSCDSSAVEISGTTVTIKDEGTYILSGSLENGQIIVEAEDSDKPQLVLDSVSITSDTSAPICVLEADKVVVTLAPNSTNTLSNGGTFTAMNEENVNGVIYSKADLSLNGSGSLTISSPAGHGIAGKDDLVFAGGTYSITSSEHGLDANDSLRVKDSSFTIISGKDGAHIENNDDTSRGFIYISSGTFNITAEGDGLSASAYMQILDGDFTLLCGGGYENGEKKSSGNWGGFGGQMPGGGMPGGGGRPGGRSGVTSGESTETTGNLDSIDNSSTEEESTSMKGLKANSGILIADGTFTIDSADDSVHSNSSAYIHGGTFTIASGDDALHAEDTLEITKGSITVTNSYEGLEALHISVSGGNISIQSTDDGFNAAGGTDDSGTTGGRDGMFGGPGGMGGMSANSNGSITISGGEIFMYACGDGLDANGTIEITGGKTIVTGPTSGDTAILDYDKTATITGGSFMGVGSTMMAQIFSDGTQGTLGVKASAEGGTTIRIENASGTEILNFTPETAYACIIISTPDLEKGETYTMYVGTASGEIEAQ